MRLAFFLFLAPAALSAQPPQPYPLRPLQEQRAVGTDEAAGVFIAHMGTTAISPGGELFVIDAGDRDLKVYDAARGTFMRRFGRQGSGPGELQTPLTVVLRDTMVHVTDQRNGYLEFARDGRHIRTTRQRPEWLDAIPLRHGHHLLIEMQQLDRTIPPRPVTAVEPMYRTVVLRTPDGRTDTIAAFRMDMGLVTLNSGSSRPTARPVGFGNQGVHALIGDSLLVVADGYAAEVRWYRITPAGAVLRRTESLRQRPRPVTAADLTAAGKRLAGATSQIISSPGRGSALAPQQPTDATVSDAPDRWSVATRIVTAHDGTVAIAAPLTISLVRERRSTIENNVYTVFPPAGAPYRIALTGSQYLHLIHAGEFYIGDRDADEPVLRVYRPR